MESPSVLNVENSKTWLLRGSLGDFRLIMSIDFH